MCVSVHVHAFSYLLVLLSFHAYGANSHLPFPSLPFAISVIKRISINIAWGNELNLKLDHVKVRDPDGERLPPLSGNCAAILAAITEGRQLGNIWSDGHFCRQGE